MKNIDTIVLWHCDPKHYLPPKLDDNQLTGIVSDFEIQKDNTLNTPYFTIPRGEFDLKELLDSKSIPKVMHLFIFIDATMPYLPKNLKKAAEKVFICMGDTHHLPNPITRLRNYIKNEPADGLIFTNNIRHAHWFRDVTHADFYFEPAISSHNFIDINNLYKNRNSDVVFYGQIGKFHPRRSRIAPLLIAKNKIRHIHGNNKLISQELHVCSAALNITLNSDLNNRIFEIAQTGALLIIDKISEWNNVGPILIPGQNCLMYESAQELEDILSDKKRIAACQKTLGFNLHKEYMEKWGILNIKKRLKSKSLDLCRLLPYIDQPNRHVEKNPDFNINSRVKIYEYFLELHRTHEKINVLLNTKYAQIIKQDLIDLPRLKTVNDINELKQDETNVYLHEETQKTESEFKVNIITNGIHT